MAFYRNMKHGSLYTDSNCRKWKYSWWDYDMVLLHTSNFEFNNRLAIDLCWNVCALLNDLVMFPTIQRLKGGISK